MSNVVDGQQGKSKTADGQSDDPAEAGEENRARKDKTAQSPRRDWLVDFSSSNLKKDAFPFATWAKLMRRVLDDREEAFLTKPESKGVRELREAIADYLRKAQVSRLAVSSLNKEKASKSEAFFLCH